MSFLVNFLRLRVVELPHIRKANTQILTFTISNCNSNTISNCNTISTVNISNLNQIEDQLLINLLAECLVTVRNG